MTYSRRNIAEEQQEACQKAQQLTTICERLYITLDAIDWQNFGMQAPVTVNTIEISNLLDLSHQDSVSILRHVQIKLLEHAALKTLCAQPDLKAVIWSPVDVVQPQAFMSLWIITLETGERIAIAEYIRDRQRVYEPYELDTHDSGYLTRLFGPLHTGEYQLGDMVTIEEYGRQSTGEIIYILPPNEVSTTRKRPPRSRHTNLGKIYTNDILSRYLVNCNDGFPHVINQWQIIDETGERQKQLANKEARQDLDRQKMNDR